MTKSIRGYTDHRNNKATPAKYSGSMKNYIVMSDTSYLCTIIILSHKDVLW